MGGRTIKKLERDLVLYVNVVSFKLNLNRDARSLSICYKVVKP